MVFKLSSLHAAELAPVGLSVNDIMPTTNHSIALALSDVTQVGLSANDTVPINHAIPLTSSGVVPVPVGYSLGDTVPVNHAIPLTSPGITQVGLSDHDTLPTNHLSHDLQVALTGYDIDVNDPQHHLTGNQADLIRKDMIVAANEWMDHIDNPKHVPINIQINISDDVRDTALAVGDSAYVKSTGTGPDATWESAVQYKLENGSQVDDAGPWSFLNFNPKLSDGAGADVIITLNAHKLDGIWLNPDPDPNATGLPDDKVDMVSLLAHEFGHGLGIGSTSSLNTSTGTFDGSEKTTWESLLDIKESGTTFTGSHAQQEHGDRPVVVTTNTPGENYQHFGNTFSDAFDPKHGFRPEVMNGQGLNQGFNYSISPLDVAVLQDLGYKTKETTYDTHIAEVAHPSWFDTHSLGTTLPAKLAFLSANHVNATGEVSPAHSGGLFGDIASAAAKAVGEVSPTHTGGLFGDIASAAAKAVGDATPTHTGGLFGDIASAAGKAVGEVSPTHTGGLFGEIADAAAKAVGEVSPTHTGGLFGEIADAAAKAVGEVSPTHTGGLFGDITSAVARAAQAVANAIGDTSPTHTGGFFGDIASAVANATGTAGANGGGFWHQAADAVHHAMVAADVPAGPVEVLPEPMITQQHEANDVHPTSLGDVLTGVIDHLNHLTDNHAAVAADQLEHLLSQFEAPTLHLSW